MRLLHDTDRCASTNGVMLKPAGDAGLYRQSCVLAVLLQQLLNTGSNIRMHANYLGFAAWL